MWKYFAFEIFFILPLCTGKIFKDLFCYECLNTDCPIDSAECQNIRSLIKSELDHMYHFSSAYLKPCPNTSALFDWRIMQMETEACWEKEFGKTKCSIGTLQIETLETDVKGKVITRYTNATVMGCANPILIQRIRKTIDEKNECDSYVTKLNQTKPMAHKMEVVHCAHSTTHCDHRDFCVHFTESKIGRWLISKDNSSLENYYARKTVILIVTFSVAFAFVLGIGCAFLLKRVKNWLPHNPKIVDFEDIEENEEEISYKKLLKTEQQAGSN